MAAKDTKKDRENRISPYKRCKVMLKQEFDERMQSVSTDEEFAIANGIYMSCGDGMDKDRFCELYGTKDGRLELMDILSVRFRARDNELAELHESMQFIGERLMEQTDRLRRDIAAETDELDDLSRDLMSARDYLRKKLEKGYILTEEDRNDLLRYLG